MQKICVIVPCFNEEKRLNPTHFTNFIKQNKNVHFYFVNDGSRDNTVSILKPLSENFENIHYLDLKNNQGKAEAVRMGVLTASTVSDFQFMGFWDADLSTPLFEINNFIDKIESNKNIKILLGSRIKRLGANIYRRKSRHLLGRVFSTFSSIILKLPVYDTQCGAKMFHKDVVQELFENKFITKWLFDVEILARFRNVQGKDVFLKVVHELPLTEWNDVSGSKLKLKDFIKVPIELLRINNFYN